MARLTAAEPSVEAATQLQQQQQGDDGYLAAAAGNLGGAREQQGHAVTSARCLRVSTSTNTHVTFSTTTCCVLVYSAPGQADEVGGRSVLCTTVSAAPVGAPA